MSVADAFRVLIRWAHALAAVSWLGGSLFYFLAIEPALAEVGRTGNDRLLAAIGRQFGEVVKLAIVIFIATGAVLTFDRLNDPHLPAGYVPVLALKVVLSLVMFWLAGRIGPDRAALWAFPKIRPQYLILILGSIVYLLAIILMTMVESSLR